MKKYLIIAMALLVLASLMGCDVVKDMIPSKDATIGDKVERDENNTLGGAEMMLVSSTSSSLTVKMENNSDSTWQSGNMRDYRLEAEKDGEWYEVEQKGEFANTMELMIFAPGQTLTHTFEFAERYGNLPAGKYRVFLFFCAVIPLFVPKISSYMNKRSPKKIVMQSHFCLPSFTK